MELLKLLTTVLLAIAILPTMLSLIYIAIEVWKHGRLTDLCYLITIVCLLVLMYQVLYYLIDLL